MALMRQFLLYLSGQKTLRSWMENSLLSRKFTRRFVAGETLGDAIAVTSALSRDGIFTALDHLGENVTTLAEAEASVAAYLDALTEIQRLKLPATVSIKVTQFGLDLSEDACLDNVRRLAAKALECGSQVEIDMESSKYTERTLRIAEALAKDCGCIRCVIQAYLHRSAEDVERMNAVGVPVRLCKGAYDELPTVAFPSKKEVDLNYLKLMKRLLDAGVYPAIATHDDAMVREAIAYTSVNGIGKDRFEFQMLYGIRRDLQRSVVSQGYRLRLYVPYGTAWYPYFMRRLAERPANVWFLLRSVFR